MEPNHKVSPVHSRSRQKVMFTLQIFEPQQRYKKHYTTKEASFIQ